MKPLIFLALTSLFFTSCRDAEIEEDMNTEVEQIVDRSNYTDWSTKTHSDSADLNYDIVFNQNEVLRFDIKISSEDWSSMQSDISSNLGSTGGRNRPGTTTISDYTPIWVPSTVTFNNTNWYKVGIRYKGNSSLTSAYQSGNKKLSFKLDFDEFEEDYPALKNQRFYGFKQLNLNNNFDDVSLMREKVAADLFRQFGLAASRTTFCVIYLDNGSGPQYYGVYTLVEEVDDTVLDTQFTNGTGNLYKPDGDAASFANGTYNTSEFELKTNEEIADYNDVQTLYSVINNSERTSNETAWKTNLENILDMPNFLKWLAANTVIQNWDTYGRMTHNYYLYNNPTSGLLTWIPWDNNESLQYGKMGGALSFSMDEINSSWPLISYIIDIEEYKTMYESYLAQFIKDVFIPSTVIEDYNVYYNLIKEYAYMEENGYSYIQSNTEFDQAVETLKTHVQSRNDAVNSYLN